MLTFKKHFFVFTLLFFTNTILAQDGDADGDGVKDNDDVCPMVKGTKANRGCPEPDKPIDKNATNTVSVSAKAKSATGNLNFITNEDFTTIMNTIWQQKQELYKDNTVQSGKNIIKSTLPKTGADKQFPVYYATNGKGRSFTYIILSINENDFKPALKIIDERIKANASLDCFTGDDFLPRAYEVNMATTNDSATFIFAPSENNMQLFRMMVYKHNPGNGQKNITLRVETASSEAVIKQIKLAGTPNTIFCNEINKVITESNTSFKNIKGDAITGKLGSNYYASKFILSGFEEARINNIQVLDFKTFGFEASKLFQKNETGAQMYYQQIISKLDACLNFSMRKWNNFIPGTTILEYMVSNGNRVVSVQARLLKMGKSTYVVYININ